MRPAERVPRSWCPGPASWCPGPASWCPGPASWCPGPILKPPTYTDERWEGLRKSNPLGQLGTTEQMGEIVMFLLTGPQFINGDCIMLEGGRMWKREF